MFDVFVPVASFVAAFVMAMLGYLKNVPDEGFKPEKLISTFVAAVFVSFLFVQWEVPTEVGGDMMEYFVTRSGLIVIVERVLKTVWRRVIQPLLDKLEE